MQFSINKRHINRTDEELIGDNADYMARFEFDDEWNGKIKTARFINGNNMVDVLLDENDMCQIPLEIVKQGILTIGVFSNEMTTTMSKVRVEPSIKSSKGKVPEPEYDVYAEIIKRLAELSDGSTGNVSIEQINNTVQAYYEEHKEELKGVDGKNGIDGVDGKDGINGIDGKDGINGITPHIGENGNWYIGEIDTNVRAEISDNEIENKVNTQVNAYLAEHGITGGTIKIDGIETYSCYEFENIPNTWVTDSSGKVLDVSQDDFLSTFYDVYVGTNADGYTVTKTSLGLDQSGTYPMYEYDFAPKNWNRMILLSSGMHSYELSASFGLAYFIKELMENRGNDNVLNYIYENVRIKIIPIVNPWGFSQSPKAYGNSRGVNINRNFDYDGRWDSFPVYSATVGDSNYNEWNVKGDEPFSEEETKIVREWIYNNVGAEFWIDCHTGLGYNQYDNWTICLSTSPLKNKIQTAQNKLSARILEKYGSTSRNNFIVDSDGSIRQYWCEGECGVPTFTLEQAPENTLWGTSVNNESGDIANYATCLYAYISQFLLKEPKTYDVSNYLIMLQQQIIELNKMNGNVNTQSTSNTDSEVVEKIAVSYELGSLTVADSAESENLYRLRTDYIPITLENDKLKVSISEKIEIDDTEKTLYAFFRFYDAEKQYLAGYSNLTNTSSNNAAAWLVNNTANYSSGLASIIKSNTLSKPTGLETEPAYVRVIFRLADDTLDLSQYVESFKGASVQFGNIKYILS